MGSAYRRLGCLALPLLIAAPACTPVRNYQIAARSLRFSLDRVEPRVQLAYPLDRSRLAFHIILGVENPSSVSFRVLGFTGDLRLQAPDGDHPVGRLELLRILELPPGGKADLAVELSFSYQDLREHWGPIQAALRGSGSGAWNLAGTLRLDAYGIPLQLPVTASQTFGAAQ